MTVATTTPQDPQFRPGGPWADGADAPPAAAGHDAAAQLPEVPADLTMVSTRELRVLSNRLYRLLDADFPPFGVHEDYTEVVEVLEERAARAAERTEGDPLRETFRDNPVGSRFELFADGTMVGYLKYHLRASRIHLLETVVAPTHRDTGLEPVVVRRALLEAHRRRLSPVPYCAQVQLFLEENPQYRALVPTL